MRALPLVVAAVALLAAWVAVGTVGVVVASGAALVAVTGTLVGRTAGHGVAGGRPSGGGGGSPLRPPGLARAASLEEVFGRLSSAVARLLPGAAVRLWVREGDDLRLRLGAGAGGPPALIPLGEGLAGRAAATREPVIVEDLDADLSGAAGPAAGRSRWRSLAQVPLLCHGRFWGVLELYTRHRHRFSPGEIDLLDALGAQAATALERWSADRTTEARGLEGPRAIAPGSKRLDPEVGLARISREATELLNGTSATVYVLEGDELVPCGSYRPAGRPRAVRLSGDAGPLGVAVARAEGLIVNDLDEPGGRLLAQPLLVGDRVVGVLAVSRDPGRQPEFGAPDLATAGALAAQAAAALEQGRLYAEVSQRAARMRALAETARLLVASLEPFQIVEIVTARCLEGLDVDDVAVYVLDDERAHLHLVTRAPSTSQTVHIRRLECGEGVAGRAVQAREPVWTRDALRDPAVRYRPESRAQLAARGSRALLAVPFARQQTEGAVLVGRPPGSTFTPDEVEFLTTLTSQAAVALETVRLFALEQRRRVQIEALAGIERELAAELDAERLLGLIIERAGGLLHADGVLFLLDEGGLLVPRAWRGATAWPREARIPIGVGLAGGCARDRRGLIVNDCRSAPLAGPGNSRAMAQSLVVRERLLGVVVLTRGAGREPFTESDLAALETLAIQAAIALDNARLFSDNRRRLDELSVLYELSRAVTGQLDRTALAGAIYGQLARVLDAPSATIAAWDEARQEVEIVLRAKDGAVQPEETGRLYPFGVGLLSTAIERRQPIRVDDYLAACQRAGVTPVDPHLAQPYWLGAPMIAGDEVVGVIALRSAVRPFDEAHARLLVNIAGLAGLAFRSARLYEDRLRAYSELVAAQDHLIRADKLRALGEMASGVAHDFNNLLTSIVGRAQMLLQRIEEPRLRRWLEVIERAALDGARTVRRLQEFTRIRRDQASAPVDLTLIVQEALEVSQFRWKDAPAHPGTALQVVTNLTPVPVVSGDPAELREALLNLILNAVDAMADGGTLTLATRAEANAVCVVVADTGAGMTDDVKRRLFQPFFTTKGTKGTGLGLSVTFGIVSRHGGRIDVETAPGQGTRFTLRLPPAPPPGEAAPAAAPPRAVALAGPARCLVVDDEEPVREMLADLLAQAGHTVVAAASGAEAIERFRAEAFDLVLTDLGMAEVNGWQVARACKQCRPTVPVLLVTGWGVELSPQALAAHGVNAVLAKPIRMDEVLSAVASCRTNRS